jgi:uncharacterized membrane protein
MQDYYSFREEKGRERLAQGLGWFGIALGLAELVAPRRLAQWLGVKPSPWLIRFFGLREITSGIGILATRHPTGWVWSRVVGDAMDLAALSAGLKSKKNNKTNLGIAMGAVAGATGLDLLSASQLTRSSAGKTHNIVQTVTIQRSPEELYKFWRQLENLPRVMPDLTSVRQTGDRRSHWVAKGPGGKKIEWDAEIIREEPNVYIAWRSLPDGAIAHYGSVRFLPATGGRGTVVNVKISYRAPGGDFGTKLARLIGQSPEQKVQLDLYRLKQVLETGQVMTTEGQPAGRSSSTSAMYDWGTTRG